MREFSVPATTEVGPEEALTDLLAKNVAEVGDQAGFRVRRGGQWQDVSWKEFGEQVAGVAKGLIASGVEAGDRVALQAKTRYEWAVIDFADGDGEREFAFGMLLGIGLDFGHLFRGTL